MHAHETPSGTRMMWAARVNAICERAHGTGSTARTLAVTSSTDRSSCFEQRELARPGHRVATRRDAELAVDRDRLRLPRVARHEQILGHRLEAEVRREVREHP